MSVSIFLVPLAIAAVSAWQVGRQESDSEGRTICYVQTRMKDQGLLAAALRDTQADVTVTSDSLVARWQGVEAIFQRDDQGIWQSHFTGDIDVEHASETIAIIDRAYGLQVQQTVLSKLRTRAPAAGMSVASEAVEADSSVTMTLNVGTAS